jgi:hypothetical protein
LNQEGRKKLSQEVSDFDGEQSLFSRTQIFLVSSSLTSGVGLNVGCDIETRRRKEWRE